MTLTLGEGGAPKSAQGGHAALSGGARAASGSWRWAAGVALYGFTVLTLIRAGVDLVDVIRFTCYWLFGLVLPGMLVFRACMGSRNRLAEDLAFGAVTGIALELVAWFVAVVVNLPDFVSYWWLAVLAAFAAFPRLRETGFARCTERVPAWWAWAMAFVCAMVIVNFDLFWFRSAPLPNKPGAIYLDMWWHLSLVHELARISPPQVPQVVGEPLQYHFFTHAHMGVASRSSGVPAEIVVFRLAMVPLTFTAAVTLSALVRDLAGRWWAGALAAWLAFGTAVLFYVWPDRLLYATSPLIPRSPTLILAVPYVLVIAWGICRLLTDSVRRWGFLWLALVMSAASATKPSVMPVVLGGLVIAAGTCLLWDRARLTAVTALTGLGIVLQLAILSFAHGGGKVTILRLVADLRPFSELAGRSIERAANNGLLLETIDSPRMFFVAIVTLAIFIGTHALWISGVGALIASSKRRSPELWFLAGVLGAGLFLTIVIDHVANAQVYFWHTVSPIGVALTVVMLTKLAARVETPASTAKLIPAGLVTGIVLSLAVGYLVRVVHLYAPSGLLSRALLPVLILAMLATCIALIWRRYRGRYGLTGLGGAIALTIIVGLALPSAIKTNVWYISRSVRPVLYPNPTKSEYYLSAEESEALRWVADNSDPEDVIASNAWCLPLTAPPRDPPCRNGGFWVTGLTGRRAVIDGYSYTTNALKAHRTDNLHYNRVPLFDERVNAVTALISDASSTALAELRRDYDLTWVVVIKRSGLVAADLSGIGELMFDNDGASIYRVD